MRTSHASQTHRDVWPLLHFFKSVSTAIEQMKADRVADAPVIEVSTPLVHQHLLATRSKSLELRILAMLDRPDLNSAKMLRGS
jgi:hypothetical protein